MGSQWGGSHRRAKRRGFRMKPTCGHGDLGPQTPDGGREGSVVYATPSAAKLTRTLCPAASDVLSGVRRGSAPPRAPDRSVSVRSTCSFHQLAPAAVCALVCTCVHRCECVRGSVRGSTAASVHVCTSEWGWMRRCGLCPGVRAWVVRTVCTA